jgi:hypothetical protein
MSLISCCALMATHAFAQSSAQPPSVATRAPVGPAKTQAVAANVKAAKPILAATFAAAGSVIVLADGIVANAVLAQIQPPADGFVYER